MIHCRSSVIRCWLAIVALLLVGCQSELPENKLGFHLLLDDGRGAWPQYHWPQHLQLVRQATGPGGYVTQLIRSNDLDPAKWQRFLDFCAMYELRPIIRLATTFESEGGYWSPPPADANGRYVTISEQYASFLASMIWPEPPIVIVGNEPNHGDEWGGAPDPAAYARFLVDTSQAIKRQLPQATILNAGLDLYSPHTNGQPLPNGMAYLDAETFMEAMVAAEPNVFDHIDGWASHPYPQGPFTAHPAQQDYGWDLHFGATKNGLAPPAGIHNRGINGYEWELWKLEQLGVDPLPVYITETGWRHEEAADEAATDFPPGALPSAALVADYVDLALYGSGTGSDSWQPWITDERVVAVTFFAFAGRPSEWGHTNWVEIDEQGWFGQPYPPYNLLTTRQKR